MAPGPLPVPTGRGCLLTAHTSDPTSTPAAVEQPVEQKSQKLLADWQDRLDRAKFHALVAAPFVIAGDGTADQLAAYRDRTILAAARSLHATFFKAEPAEPILILLFETGESYRKYAKEWLGDEDVPHYGYFRHDNVMVMNVSTGLGTLVHELTHALIKPDFPAVPSWFNEGLASLYEQCSLGEKTITGHENWRLPALQKAIKADKLRSLEALINDPDFYRRDLVGLDYAEARYLMFYLQEKGLLVKYYTRFRDGAKEDPKGLETLKKIIAPQTLEAFEKDWRAWVLTLRFE